MLTSKQRVTIYTAAAFGLWLTYSVLHVVLSFGR